MFETLAMQIIDLMNKNLFSETPGVGKPVDNSEGQNAADAETTPVDTEEDADAEDVDTPIEPPPTTPQETFPREVVTKLRQENQGWRKKLRDAEAQIKKFNDELGKVKKTQEDDKKKEELAKLETTDRLNVEIKDLIKQNEELKGQVGAYEAERGFMIKTKRVEDEARALGFIDPSDAVNLMDQRRLAELGTDTLDLEVLKDELEVILEKKPYLAQPKGEKKTPAAELPTNPSSEVKPKAKTPGKPEETNEAKARAEIGNFVRKGQGGEALKIFLRDIWGKADQGTTHQPRKAS